MSFAPFAGMHRGFPAWSRRHRVFLLLLVFGTALRVLTMLSYRPALLYPDSVGYLATADRLRVDPYRPSGYAALLTALPYRHHLWVIPLVQHLAGLAVAVLLYVVVLRLVQRPWVAALAVAPLLLDALMLDLEQYVMSDVVYALELTVACVLLVVVRRPRLSTAAAFGVAAGLIFGVAAITRTAGAPVALAAVLVVAVGWGRPRLRVGLAGGAGLLAALPACTAVTSSPSTTTTAGTRRRSGQAGSCTRGSLRRWTAVT